jgi:hypothetical protein
MRTIHQLIVCVLAAVFSAGCVVREYRPAVAVEADAEDPAPVVEGPGVEVVEVEPPPVERVYVYDEGYPPGTYLYGGYYYYGGRRYEHDVFVNRIVERNIRERRYMDVHANRERGQRIEQQHRERFARTGGRRTAEVHNNTAGHNQHPENHNNTAHNEHPANHPTQRPVLTPGVQPVSHPPQEKPKPQNEHVRDPEVIK